MIDAYAIFRDKKTVKWWQIHNWLATNPSSTDLNGFVKNQRPAFIDATTDPFTEKELVSVTRDHQLHRLAPVLVADRDMAVRNKDLNFVFYPLWILSAIEKHTSRLQVDQFRRSWSLSCLNRIPRLHRFLTYYLLSRQPWFDQVYVSFAGIDPKQYVYEITDINQLYALGSEVKNFFDTHSKDFPMTKDPAFDWISDMHEISPAYTECWANLATETSVQAFCVTEKTTKALRAGCLFFPVASASYIQQLEHMGFDFDFEYIDYSFDQASSWQSRVAGCVDEIARVYKDLEEIWHANRARLQHNSDWFLSANALNYCLQDVRDYV